MDISHKTKLMPVLKKRRENLQVEKKIHLKFSIVIRSSAITLLLSWECLFVIFEVREK